MYFHNRIKKSTNEKKGYQKYKYILNIEGNIHNKGYNYLINEISYRIKFQTIISIFGITTEYAI